MQTLKVLPSIWIVVVLLVPFVINPLVTKVSAKFVGPTDGYNARILFAVLFSVTFLSIILTVVGAWIGMRHVSLEPIQEFFYKWLLNFFIAFWIELLMAQPIARFVMRKLHAGQEQKAVKAQ